MLQLIHKEVCVQQTCRFSNTYLLDLLEKMIDDQQNA